MKINILVKSPLLQKSLDSYLSEYISSYDECDFVLSDESNEGFNKPVCLINFDSDSDISRPFYRESLMADLQKFYKNLGEIPRVNVEKFNNILDVNELIGLKKSLDSINGNDSAMKSEIEAIVKDFTNKLVEVLKKN